MPEQIRSITEKAGERSRDERFLIVAPPLAKAALSQVLRKVPAAEHAVSTEETQADVFRVPITPLGVHETLLVDTIDEQTVEPVEYSRL